MTVEVAWPVISLADLRRHDGTTAPAYVAYAGRVFDVSRSHEWRRGLHRNLHWAGQDLTDELADAPHGVETLLRFPVVGVLYGE
jgi:predicted heme/steroid binding protein